VVFGAKTNGNPRFAKHKRLRSSGKSTPKKKKFIIVMKSGASVLGLAKFFFTGLVCVINNLIVNFSIKWVESWGEKSLFNYF